MQHALGTISKRLAAFTLFLLCIAVVGWSAEGLQVQIEKVTINQDLKPEVQFTLKDAAGAPLGLDQVPAPRFILARLDVIDPSTGSARYWSYNTRTQTVPQGYPNAGASATQATYDTGGQVTQIAPGRYVYVFRTAVPADYDRTKTHTVSSQFDRRVDGIRYVANPVYHFVPNGSKVEQVRKVTTTETCNTCHTAMGFHGGARMEVALCILCHSPQSVDPDTGNSVDMTEMIHKIHMGANLPSVRAGGEYKIIGNNQSLHDFSNIHFPQDIRNCQTCHTGEQGHLWKTAPSRMACGSCHDDVNFQTGAGHGPGIPQLNDAMCSACHAPDGADFGTSVAGAHVVPAKSNNLKGINIEIVDVLNAAPGQRPTIRYTVKNDDGSGIEPTSLSSMAAYFAGPHTEYQYMIREDVRNGSELMDGVWAYTFNGTIPAAASGTLAFMMEGRRTATVLDNPDSTGEPDITVTEGAINPPPKLVSLDSSAITERREIVDLNKCNVCHDMLSLHGGQRFTIDACVMCHNPVTSDVGRRPDEVKADQVPVTFSYMIHKIHKGSDLSEDYTVYGFGNTPHPYKELVHFPGQLNNCTMCHVSMPTLPLSNDVQPINIVNASGQVHISPTTASCTSCHDMKAVVAHAELNTTAGGVESCAVCHRQGRIADIVEAHVVKTRLNVIETFGENGTPVEDWNLFQE